MNNFVGENRMVIGAADAYEESIGDQSMRTHRLSFDISRGYAVPMIVGVTDEDIENQRVEQLRRDEAVNAEF